jgi:DNA-binding transcriptional ArsR family regulator
MLSSKGEMRVGALCDAVNLTQPAMSHHLGILRIGGIVQHRREGKGNLYGLTQIGGRIMQLVNELDDEPSMDSRCASWTARGVQCPSRFVRGIDPFHLGLIRPQA